MKHKKTSQMLWVFEPFIHLHILPPTVVFLSSGHPSKGDQDKNIPEMERGGVLILYSRHSEGLCGFPYKLGEITSSCWWFFF